MAPPGQPTRCRGRKGGDIPEINLVSKDCIPPTMSKRPPSHLASMRARSALRMRGAHMTSAPVGVTHGPTGRTDEPSATTFWCDTTPLAANRPATGANAANENYIDENRGGHAAECGAGSLGSLTRKRVAEDLVDKVRGLAGGWGGATQGRNSINAKHAPPRGIAALPGRTRPPSLTSHAA